MIHTYFFLPNCEAYFCSIYMSGTKFDELVSLLVSDRLKSSLSDQCLKYVLSIENNLPNDTQQWLQPQRLAEIVDEHVSYVGLANTRASYIGQQTYGQARYQSQWHKQV